MRPGDGDLTRTCTTDRRHLDRNPALPRFSLDRRITVLVMLVTIAGAWALWRRWASPSSSSPAASTIRPLSVRRCPGEDAPAKEVLDKIVLPLEEELEHRRGIEKLDSLVTARDSDGLVDVSSRAPTWTSPTARSATESSGRAFESSPTMSITASSFNKDDASGIPVFLLGVWPSTPSIVTTVTT